MILSLRGGGERGKLDIVYVILKAGTVHTYDSEKGKEGQGEERRGEGERETRQQCLEFYMT